MACEACGGSIAHPPGPALWGTRIVVANERGSLTMEIDWCLSCLHIAYDAIEKAKEKDRDA